MLCKHRKYEKYKYNQKQPLIFIILSIIVREIGNANKNIKRIYTRVSAYAMSYYYVYPNSIFCKNWSSIKIDMRWLIESYYYTSLLTSAKSYLYNNNNHYNHNNQSNSGTDQVTLKRKIREQHIFLLFAVHVNIYK